ncbi:NACHT, LRR and PYD domains-containing protein 12-like [Centropristis striata]|uniref:NACHT, LRR and PYD domains-containing protein 12-like n=1 Tax=Centropristis striata TaxID=184440 RepID=UPI0027DF6766|nr:NACHT, LRR and PYD domains-containing protein 12-like [Centropristis striata]
MATSTNLLETLENFSDEEFKKFKWFLQQADVLEGFPAIPKSQLGKADRMDTVDEIIETYDKNAVEVTIKVLKLIKRNDLAQHLLNINSTSKQALTDSQRKLKSNLQKKFKHLFEQNTKSGKQMLMNEIYTELLITEERSEKTFGQNAKASSNTVNSEQLINFFQTSVGQDGSVRTLLTKGVAGIGKTVLTRKFTLDWAEEKIDIDADFIFPFTFRELNLLKEKKYSWVQLLHHFFADTKGISCFDKLQIVFVLDGLNECQLPLDFHNNEILTDITASASVDVLLTNLIMGKLFPSSSIWITTTPEAAGQIPPEYIRMVTKVEGFTDPKKDEYFRKRFRNKALASRIITHIKTSRSLHVMCQIPFLCWITAAILEDVLKTNDRGEPPNTFTELYIYFLLDQFKLMNEETNSLWNTETSKIIISLGKLAFEQLQKGNLIFYEADLIECGVDIRAASVSSGVFTQILKEDHGLNQDKRFCFVHSSLQEFLAAVHVIVSFINSGVDLLSEEESASQQSEQSEVKHLFQNAVDKALQSRNGHLDSFLRFLVGLSLQTNQALLQVLLTQTGGSLQSSQDTAQYIKKKIRENPNIEKNINLFHCLNELNDHSVAEEIQQYLSSGSLSTNNLSHAQWSALVFMLLSSQSGLDVFDLKKYSASEEGLLRMMPVLQASSLCLLRGCKLSEISYKALASGLCSLTCNVRELDLSSNNELGRGFTVGLKYPQSKLETRRLKSRKLTSNMRELDTDKLGNGLHELTVGLKDPQCKLETLRLCGCDLASMCGTDLSSVLSYPSSSLRELDLTFNHLGDEGVEHLSVGLQSPHCRLKTLRLVDCRLTWRSCDAVAFFLSSQSSSLRQLDLSMNHLGDSGVLVFISGLKNPHCKLETLRLSACYLSGKSCETLAPVLSSQTSSLRVLDMSKNNLKDSGVNFLSTGLESPHCNLEALRLGECGLSERSCEALAPALSSQTARLKELDLNSNDLLDSGVKFVSDGLKSPQCRLETLRLSGCQVTEEGCASLASALSSNPSHLKELDLSYNHPGDSGVAFLSAGLENPQWRLETLKVDHGGVQRLKTGLQKYACELTLDPNTAHRQLRLSKNNTQVAFVNEGQPYEYHQDRFQHPRQLLCRNGLTGRCYWEVEHKGRCCIAVAYRGISRRGSAEYCLFGRNDKSWTLTCDGNLEFWHNTTSNKSFSLTSIRTAIDRNLDVFHATRTRLAMYLDWPAGTLSFYAVCSNTLFHVYTFFHRFTEPLFPGFGFEFPSQQPHQIMITPSLCV